MPREALYIGMAGVLPYLATSLSTVYLAWDINHAHLTGSGFLLSGENAELLLHIVEPLQIGYGAVVSRDECRDLVEAGPDTMHRSFHS